MSTSYYSLKKNVVRQLRFNTSDAKQFIKYCFKTFSGLFFFFLFFPTMIKLLTVQGYCTCTHVSVGNSREI